MDLSKYSSILGEKEVQKIIREEVAKSLAENKKKKIRSFQDIVNAYVEEKNIDDAVEQEQYPENEIMLPYGYSMSDKGNMIKTDEPDILPRAKSKPLPNGERSRYFF